MYGTMMRGKLRKDRAEELFALSKEWDARERKRAVGYINSEIIWLDEGEGQYCLIVRFTNREAYVKNANSPEMHAFYQKVRACLEADSVWTDGTFTAWDSPYARPRHFE